MRTIITLFLAILLFTACLKEQTESKRFVLRSPEETGIDFENKIEQTERFNIFSYRNFYNGGGVALGDVNKDGLTDIYLTRNMGPNKLYLNQGDFRFRDVTEEAGVAGSRGWSTGVVMVDINHDDWLDIYVCNAGYVKGDDRANELFINQGDGTFLEKASEFGLDEDRYTTHAAFFDYDLDGDLDVYMLNNSFIPVNTLNYANKRELRAEDWPVKDFLKGGGDRLLRNDNGVFVDVSEQAGIYGSLIGFGLGVTVGDINGDAWPDLYVSNDFFERDYLYINQADGTFSEEIKEWMPHLSLSSMGADMADINNDGHPEIFVTEMLPQSDFRRKTTTTFENYNTYLLKLKRDFYHQYMQNTLHFNHGDETFSEIAYFSGVAASDWSWGALMFDANNDGNRDIYICNGVYQDVTDQDFIDFFANDVVQRMVLAGEKEEMQSVIDRMPSKPQKNKLFVNQGDLTFRDKGEDWGFDQPSFSNGAAYGDLDNDGDLDLVVNNLNMKSFVFENRTDSLTDHHYLSLELRGTEKNTRALGAKVSAFAGDQIFDWQMIPSRGFQSSIDYRIHFGLGTIERVDSMKIVWPDRTISRLTDLPVDTLLFLRYDELPHAPWQESSRKPGAQASLFEEASVDLAPHAEDEFIDFDQEGLVIRKLSQEGPAVATGDVNGDGESDIFIGGAAGSPAHLYVRQGAQWIEREAGFSLNRDFEDVCAIFFDADGDGDQDLFVGSGGNHRPVKDRLMLDRVYVNDGQGGFSLNARALPANGFNTAQALALDVDADGDQDLIVASRSVPSQYGRNPRSYLYRNQGDGHFEDATEELAPDLLAPGMLTDLKAADLTGDGGAELILTGEWMAPMVLQWDGSAFRQMKTNLSDYSGWWYALEAADVDGDGDQDLILGNRGENFYFTGSPDAPAKLWVSDFDENKTVEAIITQKIDGRDMPVPMKRELTANLPGLKKQNLKHAEYATKSIQDLFPAEVLAKADVKTATYFKSAIAYNQGNGEFTFQALPREVQFSCVCDLYCGDLNGDGLPDILMAGNDDGFMPQFSKLDGSYGHTLINQGNEGFEWVAPAQSGFFVKGQVRALNPIRIGDEEFILVGLNNQSPRLFKRNKKNPDLLK